MSRDRRSHAGMGALSLTFDDIRERLGAFIFALFAPEFDEAG
jgi:hypothetical protein